MIQRIKKDEYIRLVDSMTPAEKACYQKRVGEWLERCAPALLRKAEEDTARYLDVVQVSVAWDDGVCRSFEDGARLLSAAAGRTDTWLPDRLYAKSARRAVRHMAEVLAGTAGAAKEVASDETGRAALPVAAGSRQWRASAEGGSATVGRAPQTTATVKPVEARPARPKHIDQYVHLLPQKTQERAAQVKGLLRDLDEAREKARLLTEADEHPDKIELWARKATRLDGALKSIYRELDREWDRLVERGMVVVDDLGNAHAAGSAEPAPEDEGPAAGQELTSEQKARRRELRKFLTDTRRGNGKTREEHVGKWQEAWKEYLTLESQEAAMRDGKILAAMEHYGIG